MSLKKKQAQLSRTESIAFCGLSIALLAVSAWITIPLGPVPFTLQTMLVVFIILLLPAREALISVLGYLALGALGAPVFSGMRGGLAALMGPTGGFLIGFGLGAIAAVLILKAWKTPMAGGRISAKANDSSREEGGTFRAKVSASRMASILSMAREYVAAFAFLLVSYVCGWAQLMAVAGMDPLAAFLAGIAPFIVLDLIKVVVGASLAHAIRVAIPAFKTKAA